MLSNKVFLELCQWRMKENGVYGIMMHWCVMCCAWKIISLLTAGCLIQQDCLKNNARVGLCMERDCGFHCDQAGPGLAYNIWSLIKLVPVGQAISVHLQRVPSVMK